MTAPRTPTSEPAFDVALLPGAGETEGLAAPEEAAPDRLVVEVATVLVVVPPADVITVTLLLPTVLEALTAAPVAVVELLELALVTVDRPGLPRLALEAVPVADVTDPDTPNAVAEVDAEADEEL